jgi:type IV secretion system protein VirB11
MSQIASFRAKLAPLTQYLDDSSITEIAINRPGEVWLGKQGHRFMQVVSVPELTFSLLDSLGDVIASYSAQEASRQRPLLSATIPINLGEDIPVAERGGFRVQVIKAPVVEEGTVAICIRKPTLLDLSLGDYSENGALSNVNYQSEDDRHSGEKLTSLFNKKSWSEFLKYAVKLHKNIVISAGTNTGKTTLLNALLKEIAPNERVVTIEDSREIRPIQSNRLHLIYSRGGQGEAQVTAVDLLEASLRLTPDRAIMGELRGAEAYSYLELLNSGHTGSITTIHADSPRLMFDRLAQMVMRFGSTMNKEQIIDYARSLIDIVIQLKRGPDGHRYISEIQYESRN